MRPTHRIGLIGLILVPIALAVLLVIITAPRRAMLAAVDRYMAQTSSSTSQPKGEVSSTLAGYSTDTIEWVNEREVSLTVTRHWRVTGGIMGEIFSLTSTYRNGSWHVRESWQDQAPTRGYK